jgi:hypothetical protein
MLRASLSRHFLQENRFVIYASRRSVTRGLGLVVPAWVLKDTGLLLREDHYLSFPKEKDLPRNPSPIKGWKKVNHSEVSDLAAARATEKEFFRLCVAESWTRKSVHPCAVKRNERRLSVALKRTEIPDYDKYKKRNTWALARTMLGKGVDIKRWMETSALRGHTYRFSSISTAKRDLWVPVDDNSVASPWFKVLDWGEAETFRGKSTREITFVSSRR